MRGVKWMNELERAGKKVLEGDERTAAIRAVQAIKMFYRRIFLEQKTMTDRTFIRILRQGYFMGTLMYIHNDEEDVMEEIRNKIANIIQFRKVMLY